MTRNETALDSITKKIARLREKMAEDTKLLEELTEKKNFWRSKLSKNFCMTTA